MLFTFTIQCWYRNISIASAKKNVNVIFCQLGLFDLVLLVMKTNTNAI